MQVPQPSSCTSGTTFLQALIPYVGVVSQALLAPRHAVTRRLLRSELICAPLALVYLYLLLHSWEPDTLRLILPGSLAEGLTGAAPLSHCILQLSSVAQCLAGGL